MEIRERVLWPSQQSWNHVNAVDHVTTARNTCPSVHWFIVSSGPQMFYFRPFSRSLSCHYIFQKGCRTELRNDFFHIQRAENWNSLDRERSNLPRHTWHQSDLKDEDVLRNNKQKYEVLKRPHSLYPAGLKQWRWIHGKGFLHLSKYK